MTFSVYVAVPGIVAALSCLLLLLPYVKDAELRKVLLGSYCASFLVVMWQLATHVVHASG